MLRVGLTGGIASGKSHVLARLAAAGCHTLDLDAVAHRVIAPGGAAYDDVVRAFGHEILAPDASVDRKALGAVVFSDAAARARLNAIVHPRVREEEAGWARARAAERGAVLAVDAALLVESGVHLRFDRLVVVHCGEAEQLQRLMRRDGTDEAAARSRLAAQMPAEEKRRFAHFEVDSSGRLEDTDRATDRLAAGLRHLASAPPPRVDVPLERALGCLAHGPARGPRGLDPFRLLGEIAGAGGLEMERAARLLDPPTDGPWYRSARALEAGPGPETLAGPLVLWALARGAPDPPFVLAASASLARLTHLDAAAVAGACLWALALHEVMAGGRVPADLTERLPEWSALAERWAGAPPQPAVAAALRSAARHPEDVAAAREACLREGGDPDLSGALVGAAVGASASDVPLGVVEATRRLLAGPSSGEG